MKIGGSGKTGPKPGTSLRLMTDTLFNELQKDKYISYEICERDKEEESNACCNDSWITCILLQAFLCLRGHHPFPVLHMNE